MAENLICINSGRCIWMLKNEKKIFGAKSDSGWYDVQNGE